MSSRVEIPKTSSRVATRDLVTADVDEISTPSEFHVTTIRNDVGECPKGMRDSERLILVEDASVFS